VKELRNAEPVLCALCGHRLAPGWGVAVNLNGHAGWMCGNRLECHFRQGELPRNDRRIPTPQTAGAGGGG